MYKQKIVWTQITYGSTLTKLESEYRKIVF